MKILCVPILLTNQRLVCVVATSIIRVTLLSNSADKFKAIVPMKRENSSLIPTEN